LAYSHTGSPKSARAEIDKALRLGLPAEQKEAAEQLKNNLGNPAALGVKSAEPHAEGPSLDETLKFLDRLISGGAVVESGDSLKKESQNMVVAGYPTMQCLIGWGELEHLEFSSGRSAESQDQNRYFVSLKDLYISELRVVDAKSYISTDTYNAGFPHKEW
jgi:hypothetical protein